MSNGAKLGNYRQLLRIYIQRAAGRKAEGRGRSTSAGPSDPWLPDEAGVIIHIKAKREGLMLSLGGDAIAILMRSDKNDLKGG